MHHLLAKQTPPQHEVYRHAKAESSSTSDIDKLKYWLEEQNFPIDKTDFYSNTVLYYSCLCNHPPLVTYLRERGATFKPRTSDGRRTFLASSNQIIRNILLGKPSGGESKLPVHVEMWFSGALQDTSFCDVAFLVNGKSFSAHKAIVAARCPYLIPKLEKQDIIVFGTAISELVFSTFLHYIYTDQVDPAKAKELNRKLGRMAKKLGVIGLVLICDDPKAEIDPIYGMVHTMKPFVNSPVFSDVILTTPDGGSFYCHKVILVTRCDYFKTFFSMKWADTDSKELQLNEVAKELLEIIVTYIYTGTYEVNPANIWEVLATAGQFLLPRLQQELEHEVMKNYLDVDSCIELATAADALGNSKIFKASVRVIANNLTTLSSTPPFLALPLYMRDEVMNAALPKRSRHP